MPKNANWWGGLTVKHPIAAYRYRPKNEHLVDSIEKALKRKALWMTPLSSQDDLLEASVAKRRPTDFSEEQERTLRATRRLITFIIQSNTMMEKQKSGSAFSGAELNSWVDEEIKSSFRTEMLDQFLTAEDERLPDLIQEARSNLRCACFAPTPLSQPMWASYASEHQGCCLEYNDYYNYDFQIFNLLSPKPVEYSSSKRILDRYDIWEALAFLNYSSRIEAGPFSISSIDDPRVTAVKKLLLTKSEDWSYQKEFRVVDFGNESGYKQWPFLKLRRIIFGAATPDDLITEITGEFSGQLKFAKIEVLPGESEFQVVDMRS
ncbi:MAG: DUF2971 domain-containing protein [Roseovarius sp.]|jgi:hypothetical protein|uniref:DUF2971 domain-containing protein n=1 Tax=Roseovarius sp. TaxID=1486281 RepID=UPI0032EE2E55